MNAVRYMNQRTPRGFWYTEPEIKNVKSFRAYNEWRNAFSMSANAPREFQNHNWRWREQDIKAVNKIQDVWELIGNG